MAFIPEMLKNPCMAHGQNLDEINKKQFIILFYRIKWNTFFRNFANEIKNLRILKQKQKIRKAQKQKIKKGNYQNYFNNFQSLMKKLELLKQIILTLKKKQIIISDQRDSACRVLDIRARQQIHVLEGHINTIDSIICQEFEPQIGNGSQDSMIKLWDRTSYKCISSLTNHKKISKSLSFSYIRIYILSNYF
ncbi:unnamed protein product [Paramecium sonneborni]|uniref:Uncharacterized protein n=1 Tax=Paramecium sonneborni TaxID=65129 RepID=A0A8S1RWT7_9CILI|nr:unnamed protein product [Paramecium sonneborni]